MLSLPDPFAFPFRLLFSTAFPWPNSLACDLICNLIVIDIKVRVVKGFSGPLHRPSFQPGYLKFIGPVGLSWSAERLKPNATVN